MAKKRMPYMVMADKDGNIFEHEYLQMAGKSGDAYITPEIEELIPLPYGSTLFKLPDRFPVGYDAKRQKYILVERKGISAVSAFLAPGYTRTLLPAYETTSNAPVLPLYAYTAVGWRDNQFWAPAFRVDSDTRCDPWHYQDDMVLLAKVQKRLEQEPENRLLKQLGRCALEYHCFAAKNVFNRRWECPMPTAMACNARCIGCISLQPSQECPASMERIKFRPTVEEVSDIAIPHLQSVERPIVSFGQGCEGEPLTEHRLLAESIKVIRQKTQRGTINVNTNGFSARYISEIIDAGLDSIRFSMNSTIKRYYEAYYRPVDYRYEDVIAAIELATSRGIFVSINLLVQPGVTDNEEEIQSILDLHERAPFHMIQMRNLNVDPDFYIRAIGYQGVGRGIHTLMDRLRKRIPTIRFGYYNPIKEEYSSVLHGKSR